MLKSLLSQGEKVLNAIFKIKAQVHERCFFLMKWNVICNAEANARHRCWKVLSQWEKVAYAILRGKAQVHERCFFLMKLNVFAMQKTDIHVLELFCRASHARLQGTESLV